MAKKFSTKKALIISALSLMICFSMLIGTTFAWFTDSVTSSNNIIKSGNLDIELYYQLEGENGWTQVTETTNVFAADALWEPGHTEVVKLKVVNEGSLALKYNLGVNVDSETGSVNVNGDAFNVSDFIMFAVIDGANAYTRDEAIAAAEANGATPLKTVYSSNANALLPTEESVVTMVVYMPTSVGNEANAAKDATTPTINLGLNLYATQLANEEDSFGPDYDSLATYVDGTYRVPAMTKTVAGAAGETLTVANDSNSFVVNGTAGDAGEITASIEAAATTDAAFAFADANGYNVASYDIKVTGLADGTVASISLFLGKSLMGVNMFHEGVALDPAEFNYDPTTGFVTFAPADYSVFELTYATEAADAVLGTYEDLTSVKGKDGNFVLGTDINAENYIMFGGGAQATLDLNGQNITAENVGQYAIVVQQGGSLTINGNGTVDCGKGFYANKGDAEIVINGGTYLFSNTGTLNGIKHHSVAQNNSKVVVNGGTFVSDVENAVIFFATSNATVEINGGFFENTADETPDLLGMGTNKANTNRIIIRGGTFVNYNPLEDRMCYTGEWPENGMDAFSGPWMLIPDGYTVVSETQANGDVWYSVVSAQ